MAAQLTAHASEIAASLDQQSKAQQVADEREAGLLTKLAAAEAQTEAALGQGEWDEEQLASQAEQLHATALQVTSLSEQVARLQLDKLIMAAAGEGEETPLSPSGKSAIQVAALEEESAKLRERRELSSLVARVAASTIATVGAVVQLTLQERDDVGAQLVSLQVRLDAAEGARRKAEQEARSKGEGVEKLKAWIVANVTNTGQKC